MRGELPHAQGSTPEPVGERISREDSARDALFRRLLGAADLMAGAAALLVAVNASGDDRLRPAALIAVPGIVLMSKALGLYDRDERLLHRPTLDDAPGVFQLAVFFSIFIWLGEAFFVAGALNKVGFFFLGATTFTGVLIGRAAARWLASRMADHERSLLLGHPAAYELVEAKLAFSEIGVELVGREQLEDENGNVVVRGRLYELMLLHDVHRLILAPRVTDSDAVLDLISEAKLLGLKVSLLPRFSEVLGSSVLFDNLHGVGMLAVRRFGLTRSSCFLKRAFDLAFACIVLVVTAPLLIAGYLAVKLSSRGPVLFRQRRIGRGGRPFEILKFRTMVCEADRLKPELAHLNEADGLFKIEKDPRITRAGRLLRRTYIDELPQLINVLRGDMSLVGPRPLVAEDDRRVLGWRRERLNIRPGMTGHWQVLGSSRIPLHEMVAIDYLYVANWSLWADLKYLLRTVLSVLRARGL